jgi:hypothetical protein
LIKEKNQRAFEELFGSRHSSTAGEVILQADKIDVILKPLFGDEKMVDAALDQKYTPGKKESNRLFKARRWINAHDADGAREIRDAFRSVDLSPPELAIEERGSQYVYDKAPFVICMGLGFTTETKAIVDKAGDGWLKILRATEKGDAIALHQTIFPYNNKRDFQEGDIHGEFVELFPRDWKHHEYLNVKAELREGKKTESTEEEKSNDYAILLRYTKMESKEKPQVWMVIAGFTAHGTAAGARYLRAHWHDLWRSYLKGRKVGLSDFCEILVGKSGDLDSWRKAKNVHRLTPEEMAEQEIACEWARRYRQNIRKP